MPTVVGTPFVAQNAPVPLEAESGTSTTLVAGATLGDWLIGTTTAAGTVPAATYTTAKTNQAAYPGGGSAPATAARVLTYNVTFPGAGVYDLYARVWVGPGGFSDDSYHFRTYADVFLAGFRRVKTQGCAGSEHL